MFDGAHSEYYDKLLHVHTYSPLRTVYAMASLDLARAAVRMRDENGIPIVGFDLAGREAGYPAEHHKEAYDYAHKHFLKKTVHAGEAYGAESIFQAITDLKADRIGHGYYLMNTEMIQDPDILDKRKYVRDLSQYIADRRITIEVCLTSNIQTNPTISNIAAHAFAQMWQERLSMTFCTDNRLVSRTSVSNEVALAVKAFQLSLHDLRNIIIYGFKRSFYPGTYIEKRQYVHDIINYYERNEAEFFPELKSYPTDQGPDLEKEMLDIEP
jgi:adenosine deaminase